MAGSIRATGGRAVAVSGDFADHACLGRIIDEAAGALGPLTLLVNNASIFEKDAVGSLDRALWDRQIAVNLTAPVFLAQAFAAQVPRRRRGQRHQPARPAHMEADAAILLLPDFQVRASHRHRDARPGACTARPRQRHRARPDAAQRAPATGALSPAGRGHSATAAAGTDGFRPHHPLSCRDAVDHRSGDRARWRAAPRLAHADLAATEDEPEAATADDLR